MKNSKNKKKLKLNIETEDIDECDNDTNSIDNKYHNEKTEEKNYNRGINKESRLKSKNTSDLDLIQFYISSTNKDYDYSYHWFEKCNNLHEISECITISLTDNDFSEPVRDYACEFELLKLITEDNYHKENLIEIPKSLKRLNRYSDILPCKFLL